MIPKDTKIEIPGYTRVGLLAGSGQFPLLFAHAAVQAGVEVVAVGFDGETDPMLAKYVSEFHMLKLGQLNKLIKTFKKAGITHAAMAGAINKTRLYARIRPDWRAVKFLNRLRKKNDDSLLRALAEELELEGIKIEPSTLFLPNLLAPEGILTRRIPNQREKADIAFGWQMAKTMGNLDIGQCLVVKNQAVLAVEGIDGTDATILRGGRLCQEGAVVVKVSKPIQDLRFDVPAVGFDTIETMKRVQARILVVEAGKTLIFDRDKMIDSADAAGITILVLREGDVSRFEQDYTDGRALLNIQPVKKQSVLPEVESRPTLIRSPRKDALRVGVVGVGYLGRFHAQKYARLPEADLVAIVDTNREHAQKVADEVNTITLQDYRELIGRVDAVSLVTPTSYHYAIARDFLAAGIHVLLEKPMTNTVEEADHLIELADKNNCVLQIGHLERFNSAFSAIRPRLKNPMFIEAHRLAFFNERGLEVDVILDLMIHDIDLALHIIEAPLKQFSASGISVLTSLPDIANVRMEFENGAVANLTASRISVKNLRKFRIFQENCYFAADYAEKRAYAVYREEEEDEAGYPQLSMEELEVVARDALEEEIISFMRCVRTGEKPLVDGREGRDALAVALGISKQITVQTMGKTGKSVQR
jgi:DUF1009 family protein/predicted dehydrogenase